MIERLLCPNCNERLYATSYYDEKKGKTVNYYICFYCEFKIEYIYEEEE